MCQPHRHNEHNCIVCFRNMWRHNRDRQPQGIPIRISDLRVERAMVLKVWGLVVGWRTWIMSVKMGERIWNGYNWTRKDASKSIKIHYYYVREKKERIQDGYNWSRIETSKFINYNHELITSSLHSCQEQRFIWFQIRVLSKVHWIQNSWSVYEYIKVNIWVLVNQIINIV